MKDDNKKLKNIINQIERKSHPPTYYRAMRKLRKDGYNKSSEAHFKRWKKKKFRKRKF